MSAALQRIAALANGLTKAELHVLIELAARTQPPSALETAASSRELAQKTGLARASVQSAIDSLNSKQLIQSDSGSATQPALHRLICFGAVENLADDAMIAPEVAQVMSHGGQTVGPVPAQRLSLGGSTNEPQKAQDLGQGGLKIKPGVAQELNRGGSSFRPPHSGKSIACEDTHRERANARADSIEKSGFEKIIDRLLKARKGDYDESLFELARNTIASHHAKFARPENRLPGVPDDAITAQFLAVAEWPKLSDMLSDLAAERKEAGHSYGWYVTVALQRIRGISPEQVRDMRRHLRNPVDENDSHPPLKWFPSSPVPWGLTPPHLSWRQSQSASPSDEMGELKQQIRSLAAARSMR